MKITRLENLECLQEARKLVNMVFYTAIKENGVFQRDFRFVGQITTAAVSVMNNITVGFDRSSNKELVQFLVISRGSVSEIKSLIYAALDMGYIDKNTFTEISEQCFKLTSLINGFIMYLKNSDRKG